jgi:hypothetical protein
VKTCIAVREGREAGCFLSSGVCDCLLIVENKVRRLSNCQSSFKISPEIIATREAGESPCCVDFSSLTSRESDVLAVGVGEGRFRSK